MNLNFHLLDEKISFEDAKILVIEDCRVFAELVKEFYYYSGEGKVKLFDSKQTLLKPAEILLVSDLLSFNLNSTTVLKQVYLDLENQMNEVPEVKSSIEHLAANISDIIAEQLVESELMLTYDEITVLELIKALGVKIDDSSISHFDKLLDILKLFKYLSKKKLLIFVNVASYFSAEELGIIFEQIQLLQLEVWLIEPRKIEGFRQYCLDQDYVLMLENMV